MKKRIASALCAAAFLIGGVGVPTADSRVKLISELKVSAEDRYTYGDFIYRVLSDETLVIVGYTGYDTKLEIPAEIDGKPVTAINCYITTNNNSSIITELYIPASVKELGINGYIDDEDGYSTYDSAGLFIPMENLTNILVDESNLYFSSKDGVLYNNEQNELIYCPSKKTDVNLPNGLSKISHKAFYNSDISKINIPDSVTQIGESAFVNCNNLKSIVVPQSVKLIRSNTFSNCTYLNSVTLPNGIKKISSNSFYYCRNLENINLPTDLETIGYTAFFNCDKLSQINLPNRVKVIERSSFRFCNIKNIVIPKSVEKIEEYAFGYKDTWEKITDFKISCYSNTIGEQYAKDNGFDYELLDKPTTTPISNTTITLSPTTYTYDGTAKKPAVTIKDGSTKLKSGTDYTVAYKNNTNAGTATVTVTGKGNYTGSVNKTFKINAAALSGADVSVSSNFYTGKALTPAPTIKLSGKTLKKGTDYTVSYKNNKNCGQAIVTITGKGNYTGSKSASFIIKPAKVNAKTMTSPKTKTVKLTWTKAAGGVTGYQVQTATNKAFTKGKKSVTVAKASATSKTVTKLKKGTKYFARVRAYKTVGKTKYYGAWSATKSIKCK